MLGDEVVDLAAHALGHRGGVTRGEGLEHVGDPAADLGESCGIEAARGSGRGPEAQTAGGLGRLRVAGHAVLVRGESCGFEGVGGSRAGEVAGAQVRHHDRRVGAAGEHGHSPLRQRRCERPGIVQHRSVAPTSSATSRNVAKSMARGYEDPPAMMSSGLVATATSRTRS